MKIKKLFSTILLLTIAFLFVRCSSDDSIEENTDVVVIPAKQSDVVMYSGNTILYSTFNTKTATRASGQFYYKIADYNEWWFPDEVIQYKQTALSLPSVTKDEQEYVKEYLAGHPNEGSMKCNLEDYFIQYAGSSYDTYHLDYIQSDGTVHHSQDVVGSNVMNYICINNEHMNDYNAGYGPDALVVGMPITGGDGPTYFDSYASATKYGHYQFYYIEYQGKTNLYLCFDYATYKDENGVADFQGDGVYNDYVIKVSPADGSTITNQNIDDEDDEITEDTIVDEVEANLSLNADKGENDYVSSKLSIHIRSITDVEVFIPIPVEYYCDKDDMYIVMTHKDNEYEYGGTTSMISYTINGNTITLTTSYEADGIRITTDGINESVIKYLQTTYGDGITFEVWNYYTDIATREQIKQMIDNTTITFIDSDPSIYINEYGAVYDYDGVIADSVDTSGVHWPLDSTGEILSDSYWTRDSSNNQHYILNTHVNLLDCKVTPTDNSWKIQISDDTTSLKKYNVNYKK